MPQVQVCFIGSRAVIHSFTDGVRVARFRHRETDDDALAHALWLLKHRSAEEAEEYLEEYLQRKSGVTCR